MAKSLIRELTIKVNAKDLTAGSKEAQKLVDALMDAGTAAELIKKEARSINTSLSTLTKNAASAAQAFNSFSLGNKVKSDLNSILEGLNRIKAAAKDIKGLSIPLDVKVGNLTTVQDQITRSIKGLDVSVNLQVSNVTATNNRFKQVAQSIEDAAAGVEILNEQLQETAVQLIGIREDANAAARDLAKVALSKNLENGLDVIASLLSDISEEIVDVALITRDGFENMEKDILGVDDSLAELNTTMQKVRIASQGTKKGVDGVSDSLKTQKKVYNEHGEAVGNAVRGMRNMARQMGDLAKLAGPLPTAFAIISANIWALTSAFDQLVQGDQLNRLEKMGTLIGANIGTPVQNVAEMMVEATNGAISYEAALRKAANASAYGFSTDQLEKMTTVARRASVVMGIDLDDALNRILKGVSKQEIELLDELGITVRLTEAQSAYAKSIGKSVTALSSYDKQQAYLNAVLNQANKSFGFLTKDDLGATNIEKLGSAVSHLAAKTRELIASLANEVLQQFLYSTDIEKSMDNIEGGVKKLTVSLSSINTALSKNNLASAIKLAADSIAEYDSKAGDVVALKNRIAYLKSMKKAVDDANKSKWDPYNTGTTYTSKYNIGNIANTTNFTKEDADQLAKAEQDLAAIQEKHNAIIKELGDSLGLNNSMYSDQKDVIEAINPIMEEYFNDTRNGVKGTKDFLAEIGKQGSQLDASTKAYQDYQQSLLNIMSIYDKIDKIGELFPELPQKSIDKLKSYADEVARLAGFNNRAQVQSALNANTSMLNFEQQHRGDSNNYAQQQLNSAGSITGKVDVAIAKQELAVLEERKKKQEENLKGAMATKEQEALQLDIDGKILAAKQKLQSAEQSYATTLNGVVSLESQRKDLAFQYSSARDSEKAVSAIDTQIVMQQQLLSVQQKQKLPLEQQMQTQFEIAKLQMERNKAVYDEVAGYIDSETALRKVAIAAQQYNAYMTGGNTAMLEANSAAAELSDAEAKLANIQKAIQAGNAGYTRDQETAAKLQVQQAKLALVQSKEAAVQYDHDQKANLLSIDTYEKSLGELEVAKRQAELERSTFDIMEQQGASQTALTAQKLKALEAEKQVNDILSQRHRDTIAGGIGAIQGENQMQSTSTSGLNSEQAKLVDQSDSLANIANSFDQLASYDQPFANVAANLSQMAIAIEDNASAMKVASIAGQAITSMFQMNGQAASDAIDAEIAAEQKRDGKSAESLAKIKALEAKKIETTRKTARQTIIMQTAVGVANALAMGNPLIGIPMAIAVAAMGMQALKAADTAAETSLAGLDDSSSVESLTLGDRTNKVDTAQTANSGELSYIQGANGTGTIQNYTPRASGNNMYAGHTYIAGEKGPELIRPNVDSIASSAQSTSSAQSASGSNINLSIHAIDAASFEDLVMSNPNVFRAAVEASLNQNGKTLE